MRAAVGFLLRVDEGVTSQVIGVVGLEGTVRTLVHLGSSSITTRSMRHRCTRFIFRHQVRQTTKTHLESIKEG